MSYKRKVRYSEEFDKSIDKIRTIDSSWIKRIEATTERIILNPSQFDHPLTGKISYKVVKYVSRSGYRIVYRFCTYCITNQQKDIDTCEDCEEVLKDSSEGIWLFDVFRKNLADTQKKGNKIY